MAPCRPLLCGLAALFTILYISACERERLPTSPFLARRSRHAFSRSAGQSKYLLPRDQISHRFLKATPGPRYLVMADSRLIRDRYPALNLNARDALAQTQKVERAAAENRSRPISSLPTEILSHIFRMHRDLRNSQWADSTPSSVRVSHVSTIWRDTALSDSSLWSKLVSSPVHLQDFYHIMMRRSKQSLIEIVIKQERPDDSESAHALAALVSPQAHRLHGLSIKAPMHFHHRHLQPLHSLSAPYMIHLSLINTDNPVTIAEAGNPLTARIFTGGIERLHSFVSIQIIPLRFYPPLTSIKFLNLALPFSISRSTLKTTLLEPSQTLSHMTLQMCQISDVAPPLTRITMPHLIGMSIISPPSDIFRTLEMIQAPRLDEMILAFPTMETPLWLGETLAARYPKLRSLALHGSLGHSILMHFPTIMELRIYDGRQLTTRIGDTFDLGRDSFSALMPRLSCVITQAKFEEPIQAFCAHRQLLGLTVPKVTIVDAVKLIDIAPTPRVTHV